MTPIDPYAPAGRRSVLLDVIAVVLMVAGAAGIVWVGFATDWRLGVGALSVLTGAAGVGLGLSR